MVEQTYGTKRSAVRNGNRPETRETITAAEIDAVGQDLHWGTNIYPDTVALEKKHSKWWLAWSTMMTDPKWRVVFIPIPYFVIAFGFLILASYFDALPPSMVIGFAITGLLGGMLMWIGNRIPKVRDYGLPPLPFRCHCFPAGYAV